jgi:hypothetical protein
MNKTANENKRDGSPSVLRFKARLIRHPKPEKTGSSILLVVPTRVSNKLRGMTRVEGTMNGHPFRAAMEANTSGGNWLRVDKAMLGGATADAGDTVNLAILGPEPEPTVPVDLRKTLNASYEAERLWTDLSSDGRRIWIRWIESAKKPETRARRIMRTVDQLSSGKRRPCCVNVYEFMLRRVQE